MGLFCWLVGRVYRLGGDVEMWIGLFLISASASATYIFI